MSRGVRISLRVFGSTVLASAATLVGATNAAAAPFVDRTTAWLGEDPTEGWSNKVALCDIDGDEDLDVLIANGAAYDERGKPELPYFYRNVGGKLLLEPLEMEPGFYRAVSCGDVDADGDLDVFFAGTFQSRSVFLDNDRGKLVVKAAIPESEHSFGDAKFADIDGDLDLDLVLADWGDGNPFDVRGRPRAWINDGGRFVDETDARFPTSRTGFSWDIEAIDVDDDLDLDVLVSCKACADGGLYLENVGDGKFVDRSAKLPGAGNNYEFEPFDLDGDGDLDLFTINDHHDAKGDGDFGERVLRNDGGDFVDVTDEVFAKGVNTKDDDNVARVLDFDADGDPDILIGSLSGDDRILVNENGRFVRTEPATDGDPTPGTLGLALGDIDDDDRLDMVMCQGEVAYDERVYVGDGLPADVTPPNIGAIRLARISARERRVVVRVDDGITPVRPDDLSVVGSVEMIDGTLTLVPLIWVGEALFAARLPEDAKRLSICAKDRASNGQCGPSETIVDGPIHLEGHGCSGEDEEESFALPLVGLALALERSRRKNRHSRKMK